LFQNGDIGTRCGYITVVKLPKDLPSGPKYDAVLKLFTTDTRPVWENGRIAVPYFGFTPKLATELRWAAHVGFGTQGLEQIEKELFREEKGLALLAEKTGIDQQPTRVSRVLFMTSDGSERFYRDCDSLLSRYPTRLLGCRLDITGETFGVALFSEPKLVRALLINDKKAVAKVLLSLI
jgi:hypothetical protein